MNQTTQPTVTAQPQAAPVQEGTRCVSWRQVQTPARWIGWAPGLYEARARADGVVTWRLIDNPMGYVTLASGRHTPVVCWTPRAAEQSARRIAEELGVAYIPDVRHGTPA